MKNLIAGAMCVSACCLLAMLSSCDSSTSQGGGIDIEIDGAAPDMEASQNLHNLVDENGDPLDVGLLILGHSTSVIGDYPAKLAAALNANTVGDGRNYIVFDGVVPGDGGFLWDFLKLAPDDAQYARVANAAVNEQWYADSANNRWSCRRLKLERSISGIDPVDASICPDAFPVSGMSCKYTEAGQTKTEQLSFTDCWNKMDLRLALVQDTSNRSYPVDDYDTSGALDAGDYMPVDIGEVDSAATPCGPNTANPSGIVSLDNTDYIDFNCDGALDESDLPHKAYALWLHDLSMVLLGQYSVDHVFISHKPIELGLSCFKPYWFPGEQATCAPHTMRSPTTSRPFDYYVLPSVYWEHAALLELFAAETDNRVHQATYGAVLAMTEKSIKCYSDGLAGTDFSIPESAGRPTSVLPDIVEDDAAPPTSPASAGMTGCMAPDHTHHSEAGGWMMAEVWYSGLVDYLF